MTATQLVQHEIRRFLKSRDPEVLCISGQWGVGKTFTWQAMLDEARVSKELGLKRYAYVSLFGLSSLLDLKFSTFENSEFLLPDDSGHLDEKAKKGLSKLLTWAQKGRAVAAETPWIGDLIKSAGPLFFSTVRSQIVCIDDIERRGGDLEVKDILGLASFLKEQRKCKVVLLLNDGELGGDGEAQFNSHFEKVVDNYLRFAPEPEDSVRIALSGDTPASRMLGEHCKSLRISNIRVIKKIERVVRMVEPILSPFDEQVLVQSVRSLTLLGWSKFQPKMAPSLDYLRTRKARDFFGLKEDKEISAEEAAWNAQLDDYEFRCLDEFDLELLKIIENGFPDPTVLTRCATELDAKIKIQKEEGSFEDAWGEYHDSFADNQKEALDSIYNSFLRTVRTISPINLNGTVSLLQELGRESQAEELIAFYVTNRTENREFWDLSEYAFAENVTDPKVIQAFGDKLASFSYTIDPAATLLKIAIEKGWNENDLTALAATPVGEYCDIFKSHQGKDLRRMISAALQFDRIANKSQTMQAIVKSTKEALTLIGKESAINARRVRKYGIVIEDQCVATGKAESPVVDVPKH